MNSFATRDDTLAALERYPELPVDGLPLDFLQGKVPKLREDDLEPVSWPADPALEWAPPGHGDVYASLATSGMLDVLLERGYRYLFLSNSDNLGAVLDPRILGWFAEQGLPFVSELTDRTESDRKGGHLARRRVGRRAGAARDRSDGRRGRGRLRGRRAPPLLQLQQHLGRPGGAPSGRSPSATACSGCR